MNETIMDADKLGNIPELLAEFGIGITRHVSGRRTAHQRKRQGLPEGTELLILSWKWQLDVVECAIFLGCRARRNAAEWSFHSKELQRRHVPQVG